MNRNAANGIFMVPLVERSPSARCSRTTIMSDTVADGLAWTADGHDVIAGATPNAGGGTRELWRIAADGSRAPQRLLVGNECGSPSVSAQGGLAYSCNTTDRNIWRIDLDRAAAAPIRLISSTRQDHSAEYSPDGKRIAFYSDTVREPGNLGVQPGRHEPRAGDVTRRSALRDAALVPRWRAHRVRLEPERPVGCLRRRGRWGPRLWR